MLMLLTTPETTLAEFSQATGWSIKPQGACKGDVCIPLPQAVQDAHAEDRPIDAQTLAQAMGMPFVAAPEQGLWAIGPECVGSRALTTATAADFVLPDLDGNLFQLSSLRGKKVLVYAWAPY